MNGIECMVLFSEGCFEDNGCYVGVLRMSLFAHTELPLKTSMRKASWSCLSLPLAVKKKGRVVGNSTLGGCMCTHITHIMYIRTHVCIHMSTNFTQPRSQTNTYVRMPTLMYVHTYIHMPLTHNPCGVIPAVHLEELGYRWRVNWQNAQRLTQHLQLMWVATLVI